MKIVLPALAVAASLAIALPASAYAGTDNFQSPSGNIYCTLSPSGASCDINEYTYTPPPPPECGKHIAWGSRFTLTPGKPAVIECHGDTLRVPGEASLNYGQTISEGTITCASEQAGVKCTDSGSGHYFSVSRDAFKLG